MTDLELRPATAADDSQVLPLLAAAMGRAEDPRFAELLRWKHHDNAFGPSPAWVAVLEGEVVGYRGFLRWELTDGTDTFRAVRAVDTATHPGHQGRGIFRTLTLHAVAELQAGGVDFVFNTPNEKSRPGYLKMGWETVGVLRPRMRPRRLTSLPTIARGRAPAGHWGTPTDVGEDASAAFADDAATTRLLAACERTDDHLRTRRSPAYLRWRYDGPLLGYRVLRLGADLAEGVACFRLRRRGPATEATIGDLLVPGDAHRARRRLVGHVLRATGADYALVLGGSAADGTVPLPGQGPTLVWRALRMTERPPLARWAFTLGDIELL